jgi:ABC-type Fe3+-hydroxamate transport system substrate-binding protein
MKRIFIDQLERRVALKTFPPRRIVSLVPSQTELLFHLGLDEEVAGITKFCVHPEDQFHRKPRIGGTKSLHLEAIAELQPDLVIANQEENEREQIEWLAERFPVWISDVRTLDESLEMIRRVGELVGRPEAAAALAFKLQGEFYRLRQEKWPELRAAYIIWREPMMAAAGKTFIHTMLGYAGFVNAFGRKSRYPEITAEDLKKAAPDIILLSSEPFPFSEKHIASIQEIVPESVIRLVDGEMFSWYGSRLLESPAYFRTLRKELGA